MQKTQPSPKVVLITGASRRIGAATVKYLHNKGLNLIVHYNASVDDAMQLKAFLNKKRANSVCLFQGDLTRLAELRLRLVAKINEWGRLDALVNNAAVFYATPISSTTQDQWDALMQVNLKAPYFLSQICAPYLKKSNGCIINIADIFAHNLLEKHAVYSATKAGMVALTRSLAEELAPNVRVNAVAPGAILWPEGEVDEVKRQRLVSSTPLKKIGHPKDVARTIDFLIRKSPFITGQIIRVDGGRSVCR